MMTFRFESFTLKRWRIDSDGGASGGGAVFVFEIKHLQLKIKQLKVDEEFLNDVT